MSASAFVLLTSKVPKASLSFGSRSRQLRKLAREMRKALSTPALLDL